MPVIRVDQIDQYGGQEVTIRGWVYNKTHKGKLIFLLIRDGYGFVQCVVFKNDIDPELFEQIIRLQQESSVIVTGLVASDTALRALIEKYGEDSAFQIAEVHGTRGEVERAIEAAKKKSGRRACANGRRWGARHQIGNEVV